MVALSVSISAKISPSFTVSPTFLNQVATVPSSIVSLKRGMLIISAMVSLIYVLEMGNLVLRILHHTSLKFQDKETLQQIFHIRLLVPLHLHQ